MNYWISKELKSALELMKLENPSLESKGIAFVQGYILKLLNFNIPRKTISAEMDRIIYSSKGIFTNYLSQHLNRLKNIIFLEYMERQNNESILN